LDLEGYLGCILLALRNEIYAMDPSKKGVKILVEAFITFEKKTECLVTIH